MPASVTVDEVTDADADAIAILIFEDDDRVFSANPEIETARTRAEWTGEKNTLVETFRVQDGREQRISW